MLHCFILHKNKAHELTPIELTCFAPTNEAYFSFFSSRHTF